MHKLVDISCRVCGVIFSVKGESGKKRIYCSKECQNIGRMITPEKFWSFIDQTAGGDSCWIWTKSTDKYGYGKGRLNNTNEGSHRIAWRLANNREIPDGFVVRHSCNNPSCCNPAHLLLGTYYENSRDMDLSGRRRLGSLPKGEASHKAKLTADQVRAIRADNRQNKLIAPDYMVSPETISHIKNRRNWRHICDEDTAQHSLEFLPSVNKDPEPANKKKTSNRVNVFCQNCGTEFSVIAWRSDAKYCSIPCRAAAKTKPLETIWNFVDVRNDNECWPWIGKKLPTGYGTIQIAGKQRRAHRVAWAVANNVDIRTLPSDTHIMHSCDNRVCCNPKHLSAGTALENIRDMIKKGRKVSNPKRGEQNPKAKLTEADVRAIRADTRTIKQIAKDYGIHFSLVSLIKRNKVWKFISQ